MATPFIASTTKQEIVVQLNHGKPEDQQIWKRQI